MESIVSKNKFLSWDGWTVIETKYNQNGITSPEGAYVKGKWVVQKRYDLTESGWEIPKRIVW